MAPRCFCACHFSIPSGELKAETRDLVEAASACAFCLRFHCHVLLETQIWEPDQPPPPPANFCADATADQGEGPEA